jgi:hypothetical protein
VEDARNLTSKDSMSLTIRHYINHMEKLAGQFLNSQDTSNDKAKQRIYLKDIDCPPVWQENLKKIIPAGLFYWNNSTDEVSRLDSVIELLALTR